MCKNIIRTLLFFAIFAVIVSGISPWFLPKNNAKSSGIHDVQSKGYLAEPAGSLDILFLGDSEGYCAFIPLEIWESHGISSYICGGGNQLLCQSYSYLEDFFRIHSPEMVILETNVLYREFTVAEWISHELEQHFPILEYHDRWKGLQPEDFTSSPNYTNIVRDKGYSFQHTISPRYTQFQIIETDEMEPVPLINQQYVRRINDFCREHNVEFVLISAPNARNWSVYHHNGVAHLAKQLGVQFVDMNMMPEEIPIDLVTDTYDGGEHLNYYGAHKATSYLKEFLWETGMFEDKRDHPEYSAWNSSLEDFREEVARVTAEQVG